MDFERMELNVDRVNSVTSFCCAHNFVDLTLNSVLGWGSWIQMEGR
jgi:hypothetical protein